MEKSRTKAGGFVFMETCVCTKCNTAFGIGGCNNVEPQTTYMVTGITIRFDSTYQITFGVTQAKIGAVESTDDS